MVTPEKFKPFAAVQGARAILKVLPLLSDQKLLDLPRVRIGFSATATR
jgi:hypothetical protein